MTVRDEYAFSSALPGEVVRLFDPDLMMIESVDVMQYTMERSSYDPGLLAYQWHSGLDFTNNLLAEGEIGICPFIKFKPIFKNGDTYFCPMILTRKLLSEPRVAAEMVARQAVQRMRHSLIHKLGF